MKKLIILILLTVSCKNEKQNNHQKNIIVNTPISSSKTIIESNSQPEKSISYRKYCNDRYKFCIDYPKEFIPQGESYNGDGQKFSSKDKKTEIIASGCMSIIDVNPTIKDHFEMVIRDENITYKVLKKDYFIISGYDKNGNIFYQKTLAKNFEESNKNISPDYFQTFMIIYPKNQSDLYSEYCKKISLFK